MAKCCVNIFTTFYDYVIPGNDDAIRAIKLFVAAFAEACMEGEAMNKDHKGEVGNAEEAMQKAEATASAPEAAPAELQAFPYSVSWGRRNL